VDRVSRMLQRLLSDSSVLNRASELGAAIQAEDGIRSAADALENLSLGKFSENDTGEA
jgi:UDP:flavonoid glycosyltransferase YjiC (YdhE family)